MMSDEKLNKTPESAELEDALLDRVSGGFGRNHTPPDSEFQPIVRGGDNNPPPDITPPVKPAFF